MPDKGARHVVGTMTGTTTGAVAKKGVKGRVCRVTKALASVAELVDAKHNVIFDSNRSYMIDKKSGEEYDFVWRNNMFEMEIEVEPFGKNGNNNEDGTGAGHFARQAPSP